MKIKKLLLVKFSTILIAVGLFGCGSEEGSITNTGSTESTTYTIQASWDAVLDDTYTSNSVSFIDGSGALVAASDGASAEGANLDVT